MRIEKINPTGRATDCTEVKIGRTSLIFSYRTLIGVVTEQGQQFRRENVWGPTTGRHINECGLRNAEVVGPMDLSMIAQRSLASSLEDARCFDRVAAE